METRNSLFKNVLKPLGQSKGFSLINLIITLGLIGILSGVGVFQINKAVNNYRLSGAASLVLGDLQNAKMTAVSSGSSFTVTFIEHNTGYSFPRGDGTTFTRDLTDEYPNIKVTKTGDNITFTSDGQIPNAATGDIVVTVQGPTASKTINLNWAGNITST